MNSTADSVESFLSALAAQLPGPSKDRAAILAELNDGLLEATKSYQRAGLDRAQAIELALREFGDPQILAGSFRPELLVTRGRRSALTLLTAAPIVLALWIAAARTRAATQASRLFDSPTDHITAALLLLAFTATGMGALLMSGRLTRWLALPARASAMSAAAMGVITVISDLTAVGVLGVRLATYAGTIHMLLLAAAMTSSCAGAYLGARVSRSCFAVARGPL
jgi:HAAS